MALRPEEVTAIIKKELEKYKTRLRVESIGTVLQVGDARLVPRPVGPREVRRRGGEAHGLAAAVDGQPLGAAGVARARALASILISVWVELTVTLALAVGLPMY